MSSLSRRAALAAAPFFLLFTLAGCGSPASTLKGKLVNGTEPVGSGGQLVSLSFHPMTGGTPDATNNYTVPLNEDGSFEFVASGGTLPPGDYRVVISGVSSGPPTAKERDNQKPNLPGAKPKKTGGRFDAVDTLADTKLTITVVAGKNDLVIDLAKAK